MYGDVFICPLKAHPKTFVDVRGALGLGLEAATILDDVRFLTLAITAPSWQLDEGLSRTEAVAKVRTTAFFITSRLEALPDAAIHHDKGIRAGTRAEDDLVTETIRVAALVFSDAIATARPLSDIKKARDAEVVLVAGIKQVSPARWKKMIGVYLWIALVAASQVSPATAQTSDCQRLGGSDDGSDTTEKFLRRKVAAAAQAVGQAEYGLSIAYLRSFWLVQRWLVEEGW